MSDVCRRQHAPDCLSIKPVDVAEAHNDLRALIGDGSHHAAQLTRLRAHFDGKKQVVDHFGNRAESVLKFSADMYNFIRIHELGQSLIDCESRAGFLYVLNGYVCINRQIDGGAGGAGCKERPAFVCPGGSGAAELPCRASSTASASNRV